MSQAPPTAEPELEWNIGNVYRVLWDNQSSLKPARWSFWQSSLETLTEQQKRWLIALLTGAFVRGVSDGFAAELPKAKQDDRSALGALPFIGRADHEAFFAFLRVMVPHYQYIVEPAAVLLSAKFTRKIESPPGRLTPTIKFATLMLLEAGVLDEEARVGCAPRIEAAGVSREPWVRQPRRDYFGVCLSGGGIRSATFNLGLLQALGEKGVLDRADYLSTVSGGGYIGGFWTAWLARWRDTGQPRRFPVRATGAGHAERERPEVRHLREFSRFLMPRVGFTQHETWQALSAALVGTSTSLMLTTAAVATLLYAWFCAVSLLMGKPIQALGDAALDPSSRLVLFGSLTLGLHWVGELNVARSGKLGRRPGLQGAVIGVLAALASVGGLWWSPNLPWLSSGEQWTLKPALVWVAGALVVIVLRAALQRFLQPSTRAAIGPLVASWRQRR